MRWGRWVMFRVGHVLMSCRGKGVGSATSLRYATRRTVCLMCRSFWAREVSDCCQISRSCLSQFQSAMRSSGTDFPKWNRFVSVSPELGGIKAEVFGKLETTTGVGKEKPEVFANGGRHRGIDKIGLTRWKASLDVETGRWPPLWALLKQMLVTSLTQQVLHIAFEHDAVACHVHGLLVQAFFSFGRPTREPTGWTECSDIWEGWKLPRLGSIESRVPKPVLPPFREGEKCWCWGVSLLDHCEPGEGELLFSKGSQVKYEQTLH